MQCRKEFTYDFSAVLEASCLGIEVSTQRLPGQSSLGQDLHISTIKLRGLGALSEDNFMRGDLNLKLCLG